MAGFKMRKRLILAKIESTYGTDSSPTAAADAVLARSVEVTPLAGEDIQRELLRSYYGNAQSVAGEKHVEMTVEVELAGSGTPGTAPAWGTLLRACGFAETTAVSDVTYNPITGGEESISCYVHRDGILHKFTGGLGSAQFTTDVNTIPFIRFRFLGLFAPVSQTAIPSGDYSAWTPAVPVTNGNTSPLILHGTSLTFSRLSVDMSVDVNKNLVVGQDTAIQISGRSPSGTAVIQEPDLATLDLYAKALAGDSGVFSLIHGTVAGNIVSFTGPKVATGSPSEQDLNGTQMLSVPLTINPDSGNDELVITVS